jgi:hypothetical protein
MPVQGLDLREKLAKCECRFGMDWQLSNPVLPCNTLRHISL